MVHGPQIVPLLWSLQRLKVSLFVSVPLLKQLIKATNDFHIADQQHMT